MNFTKHPTKKHSPKTAVFGAAYPYNGETGTIALPMDAMPGLPDLFKIMNMNFGTRFNSLLLNMYYSKHVCLGTHQDNEGVIVAGSLILTLSIGAIRRILFSKSRNGEGVEIPLLDNSVLVMLPGCQQHLWHSVIKGELNGESGVRYSLTFRELITNISFFPSSVADKSVENVSVKEVCDVCEEPVDVAVDVAVDDSGAAVDDSGAACDAGDAETNTVTKSGKVLIIGDSLVGGRDYGINKQLIIKDHPGIGCEKVSKPGAHVTDIIRYLEKYPDPDSLSDIVVLVGGNDVQNSSKSGPHQIKSNFNCLAELLQTRFSRAKVYLFSIIPREYKDNGHSQRENEVNMFLIGLCNEYRFKFLDRRSHFRVKNTPNLDIRWFRSKKRDWIHLSDDGNMLLGKVIIGAIFYPRESRC